MYQDGYNPRAARQKDSCWTGFVASKGDLSPVHLGVFERHRAFIESLDTTAMVKSYKMVVLLAMINAGYFPGEITLEALADEVERLAGRTTRVAHDLEVHLGDRRALLAALAKNPIEAWVGGKGTGDVAYFAYEAGVFRTTFDEPGSGREALQELVREVAEWRLTEYLDRSDRGRAAHTTLKVIRSGDRPILMLPSGAERDDLPDGWMPMSVDGRPLEANFAKIAINVVREPGMEDRNELPAILRGWFGQDAGAPGTRHQVALRRDDGTWSLGPEGIRRGELRLWQSYSREEIPGLFGMPFSQAIWNVGYVRREGHIFLLVTLDKSGHADEFKYGDRFLAPNEFQWQSQNRTMQGGQDGQAIRNHVASAVPVHLFVRRKKRQPTRGSMPFIYCGDVVFQRWEGEKPITVWWSLPTALPEALFQQLSL
jgi:hypothetical protein